MMIQKLPFQLFAVGIVSLVAIGCSSNDASGTADKKDATAAGGTASTDKKDLQLAFVTNNASDFWKIAEKGVEKAEKEDPTLKVDFKIPPTGSAAEQQQIISDLLAKGVQGFAISVKDPANQKQLLNDAAKKAMIFTQDSDAPDSDRTCYVGTDNKEAGKMAGEAIKKALPNGGKIMFFVGSKDVQNAHDRAAGIEEVLKGTNITIVDTRTDETDRAKAITNVSDAIVKDPSLACLVGLWSYNGPAIHNALKAAGKLGKIKIVCFDEEDETLSGVKDGSIDATVVQQPFEFGYQAITRMAKALRGDKSVIPAEKKVIVPTKLITKDNVDEFWSNLKKQTGKG